MKVTSELADIEFGIGAVSQDDGNLVITSDADSTMATTISVSPADFRRTFRRLVFNGSFWGFMLTAPFRRGSSSAGAGGDSAWNERRGRQGINKPW